MGSGSILGIPTNMAVLIVVADRDAFLPHARAAGRAHHGGRLQPKGRAPRRRQRQARACSRPTSFLARSPRSPAIFYAARQNSSGTDTGVGWEINALAAVVLGGISLAGGRGTIARAMMGAAIIFMLISGLVQLGAAGNLTTAIIGIILLVAVGFNVKWVKNKGKMLQKVYVVPSWVDFAPPPSIARDSGTVFAENDRLKRRRADRARPDRGTRRHHPRPSATISTPSTATARSSASSRPTMPCARSSRASAGDRSGSPSIATRTCSSCIAGMGVYGVKPDRTVFKVTDRTNRTWTRLKDDSRLYLADDLDVAPDGKIYFSEATTRYELADWALDGFEGRGNGRLICHDPKTGVTRTDSQEPHLSQRRLRVARRRVGAVGEHLALPGQPLLDRRPKGRH